MQFEWDREKRLENIRKHNIDFKHVVTLFYSHHIIVEDGRFEYGEERFWAVGFFNSFLTIVVHTYVRDDLIRIISARKATKYEQQQFSS